MGGIKKKDLDILKAYEDSLKDPHRYDKWKYITPPLAIVVVVALVCGILFFNIYRTNESIKDTNRDIATTKAAIEATDKDAYSELKTMQEAVNAMNAINKQISGYVPMSSTKLNKIVSLTDTYGVDITSLEYAQSNAQLTIGGSVDDPDDIYSFITAMRKSKLYKNLQYTGYTKNDENTTTETNGTTMASGDDGTEVTVETATDDEDDDNTAESSTKASDTKDTSKSSASTQKQNKKSSTAVTNKSTASTKKSADRKTAPQTSTGSSATRRSSARDRNAQESSVTGSSSSTRTPTVTDSSSASTSDTNSSASNSTTTETAKTTYTFTVTVTLK